MQGAVGYFTAEIKGACYHGAFLVSMLIVHEIIYLSIVVNSIERKDL